jgi:hypothetical protein
MLENMIIVPRRYPCAVRTLLETLSETDKAILQGNLENPDVASYALTQALKAVGVKIADSSIARHRRATCSCSKT